MLDITRFIYKHTRGFNCQVIRQFDGLTRICGWKQRKPWPTTISVIGLLVSPRCFTPALMFARESWYSLFPVLSDTTWPTQICLLISNYNSDSTVILPSFRDVYQYWNYYSGFFFIKYIDQFPIVIIQRVQLMHEDIIDIISLITYGYIRLKIRFQGKLLFSQMYSGRIVINRALNSPFPNFIESLNCSNKNLKRNKIISQSKGMFYIDSKLFICTR